MIEIVRYACSLCGTEYNSGSEALQCEESHKIPQTIDGNEWMFGKKYPDKMTVEMDDGAVCQYNYYREVHGANDGE